MRRAAVAGIHEPELLQALPSICSEDEDPGVRSAAGRRVSDLAVLKTAWDSESDASTKDVFLQRIRQLTISIADDRPPLESRQMIVSASEDRQLLEQVASQAPEAALRKLALGKTTRQGFLGDRALQDPDPELRRLAAGAITQLSTLRRIIQETRKSDKALHQELSARLQAELLNSGDPKAVQVEALALCTKLEAFALQHTDGPVAVPEDISSRWNRLEQKAPAELADRYQRIVDRLDGPVATPEEATPEVATRGQTASIETPAQIEDPIAEESGPVDDSGSQSPDPVPATANPLPGLWQQLQAIVPDSNRLPPARKFRHLQEKWQHTWSKLSNASDADQKLNKEAKQLFADIEQALELAQQKKEQAITQAQTLLGQIESELEDGALHKALETKHALTELGKTFKNDKRWKTISHQMTGFHGRIRELRDWHHWSNDKIRKQLIGEMEILPETDLHPDAILDRIKSLQSQWKDLEKSEQIPGDSHYHAAPWMWRKFSAAGHKAFEATKPFLEKRDEIRDRHLQVLKKLCSELVEAADAEDPDVPVLNKLLQSARKEMRDLDQIPHKARKKMAARLRTALEKGNAVIQGNFEAIEKQKLKLVRAAAQLVHAVDNEEAIREAKRLQADWKAAGRLWRSRENELWKAFREPLDPLFGKLKATQDSEREEIKERLQVQEDLCRSLKELLAGEDQGLLESQGKVQGLRDGWRDIEHPNRPLQNQFQDLADKFDQRIANYRHKEADNIRQGWWEKAKLLHQLETAILDGAVDEKITAKAQKQWPQQDSAEEIDQILNARFRLLIENPAVEEISKETSTRATELCIQLEFLAGIPSPKADKDQRMKYQVDRLSKSLSGDSERLSAAEEARSIEQEWLKLAVLPASKHKKFERRLKTALDEVFRINSD